MARTNLEALQQLGQDLNLKLAFNPEGVCDLEVGEAVVTLEGDPEGTVLRFNGSVGHLPDSESPGLLRLLLNANFNGQGVGMARLGMDHVTEEVVLGRTLDIARLDTAGLSPELEEFVNYLTFWKQQLPKSASEVSAAGDAQPPHFVRA